MRRADVPMFRDPRRDDHTICTTAAPDFAFTVRTYGTRPPYRCVELTTHSAALCLTATDWYRVAFDRLFWTPADPEARSLTVLVPSHALETFSSKGQSGKVAIHLSAEMAGFADDVRTLTVRTRSGSFPKWRTLLPAESPLTLITSAPALSAIIGRVGTMCGKGEPIALTYAGGTLTVQAIREGRAGAASESLPATADGADEFEVRFYAPYFTPMLDGFDGDVSIGLPNDPAKPKAAIMKPCGNDTFAALVVQTPIR
jgi:DNA polymerase III subunit beta